jgi:hypothetical protein
VDQRKGNVDRINIDGANGEGRTPTGVSPLDPKGSEQVLAGIKDADLRAYVAEVLTREDLSPHPFGDNDGYNPPKGARSIRLSSGETAYVDPEDYRRVSRITWRMKRSGKGNSYPCGHLPRTGKRGKDINLHRFILGAEPGVIIDHIDGNTLNNTRANLRACSNSQNLRNSRIDRKGKTHSKYKGVYQIPDGRWRAQIMCQYKKINLGTFASEKAAALAYDFHARKLHGAFARLNFPPRAEVA